MTTQQQIDDPGQWRVGDYYRGEYAGHPFEGPIWSDGRYLRVGNIAIRHPDGVPRQDVTITVTRTVEPIPEPTGLRARLLDLADGFDADAADIAYSTHPRARALATAHAHNLRALLAEGGEA